MEIKSLINKTLDFSIRRLFELIGVILVLISIYLFLSLYSYSPEDPNFIFNENTEIKNLLGIKGSLISDIFFQSLGFISFLIPLTILFTGINIAKNKKPIIIIENIFFSIIYLILGSTFFSIYHSESFWLAINGNGGFVGNFFKEFLIPFNSFF